MAGKAPSRTAAGAARSRTSLTYNQAGQPLTESYAGGTLAGLNMQFQHDQYLRRTNVVAKNGANALVSAGYGYDAAGRLGSVTNGTLRFVYAYHPNSMLVNTLGFLEGGSARLTMTRQYDKLNRLLSIASVPSASGTIGYAYQYNAANQRTGRTEADGSYWVYGFDALGQVVSGRRYWGDGTPVAGEQFEYAFDDIGNRENTGGRVSAASTYSVDRRNQYGSRTVAAYADVFGIANPTANVTVNGNTAARKGEYFHHALSVPNGSAAYPAVTVVSAYGSGQSTTGHVFVAASPETFTHDADGNLTQDGRWAYTWDGENRLTQMLRNTDSPLGARQRLSFQYDHQGRRIMKAFCVWTNSAWSVVSSNKFLYDGWNVVAELNATNNALIRSYTWGTDLSGSVQGAGGVGGLLHVGYHVGTVTNGFVAYDGNGNVAGLVRASDGTTVARYDYGPFAEPLRATGPMAAANPMRFSTKYQDGESSFLYYGHRYYNPSTGNWLNRDPIGELGGLNVYGFLGNDGINKQDYLGNAPAAQNPVPTLEITHNNGVRPGFCGGVSWKVYYRVQPASTVGGWIVQKLTISWEVRDCSGKLLSYRKARNPGNATYWEAWEVHPNLGEPEDNPDHFGNTPSDTKIGGDCTYGTLKWNGSAAFYEGLQLPSTFTRQQIMGGGPNGLPSTTTDPNLTGGSSSLSHILEISWNCCPAGKGLGKYTRIDAIAPFAD